MIATVPHRRVLLPARRDALATQAPPVVEVLPGPISKLLLNGPSRRIEDPRGLTITVLHFVYTYPVAGV